MTPASIIEPAVGACTCASGSHVCTGTLGIFVANPTRSRNQTRCLSPSLIWAPLSSIAAMSKERSERVAPVLKYITRMPMSIRTLAVNV